MYRELIWYVCPLLNATRPPRVYMVSLSDRPYRREHSMRDEFQEDEITLVADLAAAAYANATTDRVRYTTT